MSILIIIVDFEQVFQRYTFEQNSVEHLLWTIFAKIENGIDVRLGDEIRFCHYTVFH